MYDSLFIYYAGHDGIQLFTSALDGPCQWTERDRNTNMLWYVCYLLEVNASFQYHFSTSDSMLTWSGTQSGFVRWFTAVKRNDTGIISKMRNTYSPPRDKRLVWLQSIGHSTRRVFLDKKMYKKV